MKKLMTGLCIALGLTMASQARAETTECTEITTIPTVITVQGVYCLKGNLATNMAAGNAIEIQTNNVTIDFNGFKLGGLAAGPGTLARGIFANQRRNIVLHNGSIRGFYYGIFLEGAVSTSSGHLLADLIFDNNTYTSLRADGTGMVIRDNRIVDTGPGDNSAAAYGIAIHDSSNSIIEGNLVSGTNETFNNYGIYLELSSLLEVRNNTVLATDGATNDYGIYMLHLTDTTIIDNRILNASGTGTTGIIEDGGTSGINCIGNTIDGFTTAIAGCDNDIGNNKL